MNSATNYLLNRCELGKGKPATHKLPNAEFSYGKKTEFHKNGVKELTSDWQNYKASRPRVPHRNFMGLNKLAVGLKCKESKDITEMRKHNDIPVNYKLGKGPEMTRLGRLPSSDFAYGAPMDIQDDFKELVGGIYGLQYEYHHQMKIDRINQVKQHQSTNHSMVRNKKQSHDRMNYTAQDDRNLFKISRFTKVAPRTQSYANTRFSTIKTMH